VSESDFLTRQAADARAAIARVSDEIKQDLARGADPRAWVQAAPWTTLATAAVAGFLAAAASVPSKEQQALRRLQRMEKALEESDRDRVRHRNGHDRDEKSGGGTKSIVGAAMGSLLAAVQPMLVSVLQNLMASNQPPPPQTGPTADAGTSPPSSQPLNDPNANDI
jgi:hypothetical protein